MDAINHLTALVYNVYKCLAVLQNASERVYDVYCVQDDSEDSETDGEEDEDTSQTSTNTQPASYYHRYTCTPQSTLKHQHCF